MKYGTLLFALLACCTAQGVEFENMTFFPVNHPECRGFVVIRELITSYRFYYVSKNNTMEVMPVLPKELNIDSIEAVEQSPDGEKVVILSVGEGHPALAIYRIADLIAHADKTKHNTENMRGNNPGDYDLSCAGFLDPHPGLCDDPKWVGNDTIEFLASGVDFNEFDSITRRAKPLDTSTYSADTWRWKYGDDTFMRVQTDAASHQLQSESDHVQGK